MSSLVPTRLNQNDFLRDTTHDLIRISVGSRSSIFQITETLSSNMPRNPNTSTPIGNPTRELGNMTSLMFTSQPQIIVFSINGNMFHVSFTELLDSGFDGLHSLFGISGLDGREVGVKTGTVPVTGGERFGVERGLKKEEHCSGISLCFSHHDSAVNIDTHSNTPFFSDPQQHEPSHPQVVSQIGTDTRSNLELPLRRHDFGIDTRDVDTSVQTSSLRNIKRID